MVLVLVTGSIFLSGCLDGFDPGMTKRCAATWDQTSPRAFSDFTDCPGANASTVLPAGNAWALGSNAPYGGNGHCGVAGSAFRISEDGSTPLKVRWVPDVNGGKVVELGVVKDSCSGSNAEITLAMGQPKVMPVKGLKLEDQMSVMQSSGITSTQFYSKIDINGQRYGLGVVLRPRGDADPRFNNPAPCVLYKGGTDVDGHHELSLDANCFGIATMSCANCAWATVDINWDDIYNWVFTRHPAWWPAVQHAYATAQTSIDIELMTFRRTSAEHPRLRIWHRGWKLWH
jgi:hypothetical protein